MTATMTARPAGPSTPRTSRRRSPAPRKPRPLPPLSDPRLAATVAAVTLVVLAGWFVLQTVALGALSQGRAQSVLHSALREQLEAQTAPTGAVEPGDPVALLRIPTLGLEQVVVEGTASSDLQAGPGHRRDSPLPGQRGVSTIYGKSFTWGAPFRSVGTLLPGDGIEVTTAQGKFVYRVVGVRRADDPLPDTTPPARLTLVTADVSSFMPSGVLYVDAVLIGDPVVGAGRVSTVPASEAARGTDSSGLPLLAVGLGVLLATVLGVVRLHGTLPVRVLWTLGLPVVLAALWLTGTQTAQLLPNLF